VSAAVSTARKVLLLMVSGVGLGPTWQS